MSALLRAAATTSRRASGRARQSGREELLRALRTHPLLLLALREEFDELAVAVFLGVLAVFRVCLGSLQRMIENADQVVIPIRRSSVLLVIFAVGEIIRRLRHALVFAAAHAHGTPLRRTTSAFPSALFCSLRL